MSDALANRMLARAIHAIETLGSGLEKHNHPAAVCLHAWDLRVGYDIEPESPVTAASRSADAHQPAQTAPDSAGAPAWLSDLLADLGTAAESAASSLHQHWRCYLALPATMQEPQPGQRPVSWLQLAARCEQALKLTVRMPSLALFTGLTDADLGAFRCALADLRQGVVDSALIITATRLSAGQSQQLLSASSQQQAVLVAGMVLSAGPAGAVTDHAVLELQVTTAGTVLNPAHRQALLTISQAAASEYAGGRQLHQQRLCKSGSQPGPPAIALSLLAMAEHLTDRPPRQDPHWQQLSALLPCLDNRVAGPAQSLVLSVQHARHACEILLRPMPADKHDQPAVAVKNQHGGQCQISQLDQALQMLEQLSGYPLRQLSTEDQTARRLSLDSLMAAEFASFFQRTFGKPLPATALLDRPTPAQLRQRLKAQLELAEPVRVFIPRASRMQSPGVL